MKLLFVITSLENGGAERVCATLANHFSSLCEVEILYFGGEIFYEIAPSVRLVKFAGNSRENSRGNSGENSRRNSAIRSGIRSRIRYFNSRILSKILEIRERAKHADCVISFMDSTNILSIISTAFLARKLIISEHSAHDFVGLKWRVLRRIFYPFADALTVLSMSDFSYYSFVKKKAVIYNPSVFEPDFSAEKKNLIIFVGRLEAVKGCDIFLRALALLGLKDYEIRILGDGSQREVLQSLSAELGLKNLEFAGAVSDIASHYKEAKIIVSSSRFEGLGNALIESAFFGCLRVATPTAGARELLSDGENGFISADFSPNSLAQAITKALSADKRVLENTKADCDKFSLENVAKQWWELIK